MPIVFDQPAPAGAFSNIARNRGSEAFLDAAVRMAGIAQSSYDQQGETAARERMGFANLTAETALRQQALGLQRTEMEMRPALQAAAIQQRAQLEMDAWTIQQRFTMQDRQELTRQENALGELVAKRDEGEISEQEFYQMAQRVAPRVNALIAKDNHTKAKMNAELQQQQAAKFKADREYRDNAIAFQEMELAGKLDVYIPPQYEMKLSEIMQDAHPDVQRGSPEYEALRKAEAAERGWAERYAKKADGTVVKEKDVMGVGVGEGSTRGSRGQLGERDKVTIAQRALSDTIKKFESDGKMDYTHEELIAEAQKRIEAITALSGGGSDKAMAETMKRRELSMSKIDMAMNKLIESQEIPPTSKQRVIGQFAEAKRLMEKYPPGEMPKSVEKRVNTLLARANEYIRLRNPFAQQDAAAEAAERGPTLKPKAGGGYEGFESDGMPATREGLRVIGDMFRSVDQAHTDAANYLFGN